MQILIKILKCNNSNAQYCAIILEKDVLFVFFMDKKKKQILMEFQHRPVKMFCQSE